VSDVYCGHWSLESRASKFRHSVFRRDFPKMYSASWLRKTVVMSARVSRQSSEFEGSLLSSAQPLRTLRLGGELTVAGDFALESRRSRRFWRQILEDFVSGIKRRWLRERRRRKVGRAYDMALEIARVIPRGSEVLDIGCGNGFIAHHLSALLGTNVVGIDLEITTDASIDYRRYGGTRFPARAHSFDAVLMCYVLHHAQDVDLMLSEMRRVLREGGQAVIYEDIPATFWDRLICWTHNLKWRNRTGPCIFRNECEWRALFEASGFEVVSERQIARMRNFMHPVCRRFYLLRTVS
jgi:ubiquinone/menaquinone biosynthesis C-methylase UbiE